MLAEEPSFYSSVLDCMPMNVLLSGCRGRCWGCHDQRLGKGSQGIPSKGEAIIMKEEELLEGVLS